MANDKDNERKPDQAGGKVDRRSLLVGGAVAAATGATATPADAQGKAAPVRGGPVKPGLAKNNPGMRAAVYYENETYLDTFNGRYAPGQPIKDAHEIVRQNFGRQELTWGKYQKLVEPDPAKWGSSSAWDNWETFSNEARESLEKQPGQVSGGDRENAMDPFNLTKVAPNLMEHLDECIRIALWDGDKGIPIKVEVGKDKKRHHNFYTKWKITGSGSNMKVHSLTLHMDCPDGGWQGIASWRNHDPNENITRLAATWKVPAEPQKKLAQIIFIFNGLESLSAANKPGAILQPVLQWTKDDGWWVRSWYVSSTFDPKAYPTLPALDAEKLTMDNEGRCYTKATKVEAQQTITGIIEGEKVGNQFNYKCWMERGTQRFAELSRIDIPELTFAVCALESYNVVTPSDEYPDPITMTSVDLQVQQTSLAPIHWKTNKVGLHFKTTASNGGSKIVFKL